MRKYFFIRYVFLFSFLLHSCCGLRGTVEKKKENQRASQNNLRDFCYLIDSIRNLPKYNYSLVKPKTKFLIYVDDLPNDTIIKNWEQNGYRVVVGDYMTYVNPYKTDSMFYEVYPTVELASKILRERVRDSIFRSTNVFPKEAELEAIVELKLHPCK